MLHYISHYIKEYIYNYKSSTISSDANTITVHGSKLFNDKLWYMLYECSLTVPDFHSSRLRTQFNRTDFPPLPVLNDVSLPPYSNNSNPWGVVLRRRIGFFALRVYLIWVLYYWNYCFRLKRTTLQNCEQIVRVLLMAYTRVPSK